MLDLGIISATIPEGLGGSGLNYVDFILLAEECGYVALSESVAYTALVVVPLLLELDSAISRELLSDIATGRHRIVIACPLTGLLEDAASASLIIKFDVNGNLLFLNSEKVKLSRVKSVDPGRRVFKLEKVSGEELLADSSRSGSLKKLVVNAMSLANAAQALGIAQRMLDMAVRYTKDRHQFGNPIGSFQAIKHKLADVAIKLEFAKPPVYRASHSLLWKHPNADLHVSHAKIAGCEAANLSAKHAMQAHGAMGYTWEYDLHIFMKRALVLSGSGGDFGFHKARILDSLLSQSSQLGATATFL